MRHRSGLSRWFKHYKIRHTYENRNVVAVSGAVLHDLSQVLAIPLRRKAVIHNPFDIPEIQRLAEAPFEMQGQDYIIHVGRFHEHKRHDRLLRAFALSKIDASLVLMGKGSDAKINQLKQLAAKLGIENKIVFRPFETNPYPWIKGARLLVLSSDCEGFGNVLVESIICQTPPVSTNCPGGPAEILTGPLARGLTALTDESLAKTLAELYASPPVVDRETIASFGINAICQQYIALVDNQK
ncbi:glycosyltransferase [Pseudomonas aeruginosa]|nr:glycosyltransferase [Pseudomonas aeruginosa]